MDAMTSAPLLARVKSWQLVGLGLTGWCTLYSVAILSWGADSMIIGNSQGGCFAATMALASVEARRYQKGKSSAPIAAEPLPWFNGITIEQLNRSIMRFAQKRSLRIEPIRKTEILVGFSTRAVGAGRTLVFETERWQEPVIDLGHAQSTDENRKKVRADLAIIVSVGTPDEAAQAYVQTHPVQLLAGDELKDLLAAEKPQVGSLIT